MADLKKRAQRRQEHWESKLADPSQLVRASGYKCPIFTDPQGYKLVNSGEFLRPWVGDGVTTIDRFDGRALLDYLPSTVVPQEVNSYLNFERYRGLVDHSRRGASESQCLDEINEKWNQITRRESKAQSKPSNAYGYKYEGTVTVAPRAIDHLAETANLELVADKLSDRDFSQLDKLGERYGISNYSSRLFPHKARYFARSSKAPAHQPTVNNKEQHECVIEFTGEAPVEVVETSRPVPRRTAPQEKKLTLLERMQLQVRHGLNKTIRHQKELHQMKDKRQEAEGLAAYATGSVYPMPSSSLEDIYSQDIAQDSFNAPLDSTRELANETISTSPEVKRSKKRSHSKSPRRRHERSSSRQRSKRSYSRSRSPQRPQRGKSPSRSPSPARRRRSRSSSRSRRHRYSRPVSRSPRRRRRRSISGSPRRRRSRSVSRSKHSDKRSNGHRN